MIAGPVSNTTRAVIAVALGATLVPSLSMTSAAQSGRIFAADLKGGLQETFDKAANVSGSPVVGVLLISEVPNAGKKTVDPNRLLVFWPPDEQRDLCVRTVTQDGRFSASGTYTVDSDGSGGYAQLHPATRDFARELSRYPVSELAVRAFASDGPDCSVSGAVHLPLVLATRPAGVDLVLLVNTRSQHATARLLDADGATEREKVDCERTGSKSLIAFDAACRFQLPGDLSGRVTLVLSLNDGFSDTEYRVRAYVPGALS